MSIRELILEYYPEEEWLFADGFDDAIIGVHNNKIVYSTNRCIEILMEEMPEDVAIEYFEFNVLGAYVGELTPIFVEDSFMPDYPLEDME